MGKTPGVLPSTICARALTNALDPYLEGESANTGTMQVLFGAKSPINCFRFTSLHACGPARRRMSSGIGRF